MIWKQIHGTTHLIMDKPKKNLWKEFSEGFKEEYDKPDKDKGKPLSERAIDGAVTGATETLFHPWRWLKGFLK